MSSWKEIRIDENDFGLWIDCMILISLEKTCGNAGFFLFMANWRQNDE